MNHQTFDRLSTYHKLIDRLTITTFRISKLYLGSCIGGISGILGLRTFLPQTLNPSKPSASGETQSAITLIGLDLELFD